MTAYDYTVPAATATRMLERYGRTVTRRTYAAGTYDPATGAVSTTTADTSRTGALFDIQGVTHIRGTLVQVGDKQLLLDPDAAAAITDRYIIGSDEYTVVSVGEVNPAGTVCLYDLHVRLG
jgi:hypothetical protein